MSSENNVRDITVEIEAKPTDMHDAPDVCVAKDPCGTGPEVSDRLRKEIRTDAVLSGFLGLQAIHSKTRNQRYTAEYKQAIIRLFELWTIHD